MKQQEQEIIDESMLEKIKIVNAISGLTSSYLRYVLERKAANRNPKNIIKEAGDTVFFLDEVKQHIPGLRKAWGEIGLKEYKSFIEKHVYDYCNIDCSLESIIIQTKEYIINGKEIDINAFVIVFILFEYYFWKEIELEGISLRHLYKQINIKRLETKKR